MKLCYSCFNQYPDSVSVCPFCGSPEITEPKEPIHLMPGTVLADRYIIGQAVGEGGFGIVYKAFDAKLETIVAVKEFFISRLTTRAQGEKQLIVTKKAQEEFNYRKNRVLAEARTMAKFGGHKSLPNVFEFFEENGTAYIVMELLQGMSLSEYLKQQPGGRISVDFALWIANEVSEALRSMHRENIFHCDIAPDNIFLCSGKDIRLKVMDLGAAKLSDSTDKVVDIILKPGYSPTEQYDVDKNNIGPWTDIYALGATMYVMLTGVKPEESTNRKIRDTVVPPAQLNPEIPENLSNTIMKAMAVDKHMRFKSVDELMLALNGKRRVVSLNKEKKRRRIKQILGISAAVTVLLVAAGLVFWTYSRKKAESQLEPASLSVWLCVTEDSNELAAMQTIADDFCEKFPDVTVEFKTFKPDEYEAALTDAISRDDLPSLFESTGLSDAILLEARSVQNVLQSEQAKECLFLDQYDTYYREKKQVPLAIDIPVAYLITSGPCQIEYEKKRFSSLRDFGEDVKIALDPDVSSLVRKNFGKADFLSGGQFLNSVENKCPVMLSSVMQRDKIRKTLTGYEKKMVFYDANVIYCAFTYEWSIGAEDKDECAAAERLLSWMLGAAYQNDLMTGINNEGQIPINKTCFLTKIETQALVPIKNIYRSFRFER